MLWGMTTASSYLHQALDALLAERAEIDRKIETVKRTIGEVEGNGTMMIGPFGPTGPVAGGYYIPSSSPAPQPKSVGDIVLAMAEEYEVFTMDEIMEALAEKGNNAQRTSVSSIVSRMVSNGELQKGPQRGTFRGVASD